MQTLKDIILLLTNNLIRNLFLTLVLKDRTTTFEYTTWSVTLFQSRFWQENPCFEQGAQPWNLTLAKFGDNNKQVAREEHTLNKAGARCGGLDEKPGLRVWLLGREDHLPVHQIVCVLYTANLQELHFFWMLSKILFIEYGFITTLVREQCSPHQNQSLQRS